MDKEIITFGAIEIDNINLTTIKILFLTDVDIHKLQVFNKVSSREKKIFFFHRLHG